MLFPDKKLIIIEGTNRVGKTQKITQKLIKRGVLPIDVIDDRYYSSISPSFGTYGYFERVWESSEKEQLWRAREAYYHFSLPRVIYSILSSTSNKCYIMERLTLSMLVYSQYRKWAVDLLFGSFDKMLELYWEMELAIMSMVPVEVQLFTIQEKYNSEKDGYNPEKIWDINQKFINLSGLSKFPTIHHNMKVADDMTNIDIASEQLIKTYGWFD